ncbi:hypothetical protein [Devosia sp.]|uniref:hypothetical protein n=1 Tax=Devosia sp. TaxID=1871048 RepID=UPI00292CDDF9|nr:hypothetical protein [Devosia sp.]
MTNSLIQAQEQLQADADAVVLNLGLDRLLGSLGQPFRVGSSAMGLMVRRDIDITVVCEKLDSSMLKRFSDTAANLMCHEDVSAVRFRNDSGAWNREPEKYPDGFYLGLTTIGPANTSWTLDIWLVDDASRQPDLAHLKHLWPRITDEFRSVILSLKEVLSTRTNGAAVPSALVYEAVVDHHIRDIDQLDAWYRARTE